MLSKNLNIAMKFINEGEHELRILLTLLKDHINLKVDDFLNENSTIRKVFKVIDVCENDLVRQVDTDKPVMVFDKAHDETVLIGEFIQQSPCTGNGADDFDIKHHRVNVSSIVDGYRYRLQYNRVAEEFFIGGLTLDEIVERAAGIVLQYEEELYMSLISTFRNTESIGVYRLLERPQVHFVHPVRVNTGPFPDYQDGRANFSLCIYFQGGAYMVNSHETQEKACQS